VVDEEQLVADSLVQILNMFGFNACSLYSGSDAVEQAMRKPYDVLISEVVLKGMSGIDAAIEIRTILPNCKVLLVSGNNRTDDMLKDAISQGHDFEILAKPVHPTVIIDWLKALNVVILNERDFGQRRTYGEAEYESMKRTRGRNPKRFSRILQARLVQANLQRIPIEVVPLVAIPKPVLRNAMRSRPRRAKGVPQARRVRPRIPAEKSNN